MRARKSRFRKITNSQMPWIVEYLPESKWDLPWNWKVYCKTFTKAAAKKVSEQLTTQGVKRV